MTSSLGNSDSVLEQDFERIASHAEFQWLRGTRWLLTGATGLIPGYLTQFLLWVNKKQQLGLEVEAWVRDADKAKSKFNDDPALKIEVPDWMNPKGVTIPDCHYIFHAASPATPRACYANPEAVTLLNVGWVDAFANSSIPSLKGFLYASSSEIYGGLETDSFVKEDELGKFDTNSGRELYPLSKLLGEAICRNATLRSNFPAKIARIFHTYGPGMDLENDGRIFADLVSDALNGRDMLIKGDGKARRAFCYLSDTVSGLLKILADGTPGEAYNVGNPLGVMSISELAALMCELVPHRKLEVQVLKQSIAQSISGSVFPDTTKLESLGWKPQLNARQGFQRTLNYFEDEC